MIKHIERFLFAVLGALLAVLLVVSVAATLRQVAGVDHLFGGMAGPAAITVLVAGFVVGWWSA